MHHMLLCRHSPSKSISRFGSSQRSGSTAHAWLHVDSHKTQMTPLRAPSSPSSGHGLQQSQPVSALPLGLSRKQQMASGSQQQQQQLEQQQQSQQQAGSSSLPANTSGHVGSMLGVVRNARVDAAVSGRHDTVTTAAEPQDYLDIPRRISHKRASSSRHRSTDCQVRCDCPPLALMQCLQAV